MTLCTHCRYAPARQDRGGYCSWDCHDHAYPEARRRPVPTRPESDGDGDEDAGDDEPLAA